MVNPKRFNLRTDYSIEVLDSVIAEDTFNAVLLFSDRNGIEFMKDKYIDLGTEISMAELILLAND